MVGRTDPDLPSEYQECIALAKWLDRHGVLYTHVPLGGRRDRKEAMILKKIGTKPGIPDYLVLNFPVCAIEMKRRRGGSLSAVQRSMHGKLRAAGWHVIVAHGADQAVEGLRALGFGPQDQDGPE